MRRSDYGTALERCPVVLTVTALLLKKVLIALRNRVGAVQLSPTITKSR
jgi:hypothetical protein